MTSVAVTFEPSFIEEAVYLAVKRAENLGDLNLVESFYQQRNRMYEETEEERENSFQRFYDEQFSKLGLASLFEQIFTEFTCLNDPSLVVVIRREWNQRAEGAELFVDRGLKTVLVGIGTRRFLEPPILEAFLRHELMHISDMLDPEFRYEPDPELGGTHEIENNLIRDRFRILWDLYVSARIREKGFCELIPLERQRRNFDQAFSILDTDQREALFDTVLSGKQWTQQELLRFARGGHLVQTIV